MATLKLGPILDEKPIKLALELPAAIHRDLQSYAAALARETGDAVEPAQLTGPMIARFMAGDRGFARLRKSRVVTRRTLTIESAEAPPPEREPNSGTA